MTSFKSFWRSGLRLASDTRGATAAVMAVTMATLIGFAGLGVETGLWFSEKRHYQSATDAAAISGAFQVAAQLPNKCSISTGANPNTTPIFKAATTMATANGYNGPLAVAGSTVPTTEKLYINNPPLSGSYTTNYCAVEAILYEPKNSLFAAVYDPSVKIGTRAVAIVKLNYGGGACDLSLNQSANPPSGAGGVAGIYAGGSAKINEPGCMLASNSPSASATPCKGDSQGANGNPTIIVSEIYSAGGDCLGSNTTTSTTNGLVPVTGGAPIPDPWCSQIGNCSDTNSFTWPTCSGTVHNANVSAGAYNSVRLDNNATYTATGTIYVCGNLTISSTVNSGVGGVTFVVQGTINITGTGTLVAQNTGTFAGMIFYQPGNSGNLTSDSINGGSGLNLEGGIYLPGGNLTFNGNDNVAGITNDQKCLVIVSYTLQFTGTNEIDQSNSCSSTPIPKINVTNVVMAE